MTGGEALLGIDLGTSAVKVLAVTPEGDVLGRASEPYDINWIQEGWAEQDPEAWWTATATAVRSALAEASSADRRQLSVIAVGLSGQVNGIVPVDRAGQSLRPAMIWLDQRAAAEADFINSAAADLLPATALGSAAPIHAAAKLVWWLRHEPEVAQSAWKVLFPKDFLTYRLTGRAVTEVTDAGASLLLDLPRRRWAGALLERIGIPADLLPEVVESPTVVGSLQPEVAQALGLEPSVPVVAGAGDMAAITAGTGVIAPGIGCAIVGTAGQVALFAEAVPTACPTGAWAMPHPMPGAYFWHGLVMTAGYCLTWLDGLLRTGDGEASAISGLMAQAGASPPGSRGLVFLPFLDGSATPYADELARAAWLGASSLHTRGDLARAVLEGVAFNFRETFEIFAALGEQVSRVRIGGGGSRTDLWPQIIADVLDTPLDIVAELDASALGAATIAGVGAGVHADFPAAAAAMVRISRTIMPDRSRRGRYDEYYAAYRLAYPAVRELSHTLVRLAQGTPR